MEMYRYEIVIYWSDEDDVYVASVPELPGCMAHGDTYADALDNIQQAMSLWVDTAREFGDRVPPPRGRPTSYPAA
jgi:predicted RNase H-like HicB family nuclease